MSPKKKKGEVYVTVVVYDAICWLESISIRVTVTLPDVRDTVGYVSIVEGSATPFNNVTFPGTPDTLTLIIRVSPV